MTTGHATSAGAPPLHWFRAFPSRLECGALVFCLALMVLLPLAEIIARRVFKSGFPAGSNIVQHLTLLVGMIGGMVAAAGANCWRSPRPDSS